MPSEDAAVGQKHTNPRPVSQPWGVGGQQEREGFMSAYHWGVGLDLEGRGFLRK